MAAKQAPKHERFDRFIPVEPWVNPWQPDGLYSADFDLLEQLLRVAVGTDQRSGIVAAAADVWAAEELRRAGFDEDEVWPRRRAPRVMPRDVKALVEKALTKKLREDVEGRYGTPGARRALPAEANVLGRAYTKQADVVIASWPAGVEVLISTKTMLSSFQKNLRNRFEEGYGDAKNLRGRHPMAALGFLYILGADAPEEAKVFAVDMLRKLVTEPDVYDCACLLVLDGAQGRVEEPNEIPDDRGPNEEPSGLVVPNGEMSESDEGSVSAREVDWSTPPEEGSAASVRLIHSEVPKDLSANQFFATLVTAALGRVPVAMYPVVRERIAYGPSKA